MATAQPSPNPETSTSKDSWKCFEGQTQESWLDSNRHVNFKVYYGLVARATDHLFETILHGGIPPSPLPMFFTLEAQMRYISELLIDQELEIHVQPIARTEKTIRALVQIRRIAPNPAVAAECEWTGAYIDPATRRVTALPALAKEVFDAKLAEVETPYESPSYKEGEALPVPAPENLVLSSEGEIKHEWIDRMGHVGLENYMFIFGRSNMMYLNGIGWNREVFDRNRWGKFVLTSKVRYLAELREGDPYEIRTRMLWMREKTAAYYHELFRLRDGRKVAATCKNVMALADLNVRKTIALPQAFREGVSRVHKIKVPGVGD